VPNCKRPEIRALKWLPARDVLGGEASDFTPWLADNLDILAEAIGLTEIVNAETESPVQEKRADIVATAIDQDGHEYPIVIENQYGITNHGHLGQLITYLAQQEEGLGVWVVESYSEAHLAAVEFLNRTSTEKVNYILAQVRFTPGEGGIYQVHFELLARPNAFVKQRRRRAGAEGSGRINASRRDYLAAILEQVKGPMARAGYRGLHMHTHGSYIDSRLPDAQLDAAGARVKVYVTRADAIVRFHFYHLDTREENEAAIEVLKRHYEQLWLQTMPQPASLEWHGGMTGAVSDYVGVTLEGQGYGSGDVEKTAAWVEAVTKAWLDAVRQHPIDYFAEEVSELLAEDSGPALELAE
jgi:hypothetical protein